MNKAAEKPDVMNNSDFNQMSVDFFRMSSICPLCECVRASVRVFVFICVTANLLNIKFRLTVLRKTTRKV